MCPHCQRGGGRAGKGKGGTPLHTPPPCFWPTLPPRTLCLHVLPTRIPCLHVCMCPCAAAGPLPSTRPGPGHLWERGCAPSRSPACSFAFTPRAGCHRTDLGPRSPSNGGRGGGECWTPTRHPLFALLVLYLVPHLVGFTLLVQGSAQVWSGPLPALVVASLDVISVASAASSVSLHVRQYIMNMTRHRPLPLASGQNPLRELALTLVCALYACECGVRRTHGLFPWCPPIWTPCRLYHIMMKWRVQW